MFLMCPATTDSDVARHDEVFNCFVETAVAEGAVTP
jgi:hypothetical protein